MPLSYPTGHRRRAPGVPQRRRRLRREPPRHGPGGGRRALETLQAHADQRPAQDRAGPGPVHPPARRRRLACSTTSSCGGSTTSASTSCPTPRTPSGCATPSAATTSPRSGPCSPSRARRAREPARRRRARGRRGRPRSASRRFDWRGVDRARSPAPATPARTASSAPCPTTARRAFWRGPPGRGRRARRPRRARHAAARSRAAAARPRARPGDHPARRPGWAGSSAGTRTTFRGRPRPRRERDRGPDRRAARPRDRRPPATTRRDAVGSAATRIGTVTSGQLLTGARSGHRPRVHRHPRTPRRRRSTRSTSTSGADASPRTSSALPFVDEATVRGDDDGRLPAAHRRRCGRRCSASSGSRRSTSSSPSCPPRCGWPAVSTSPDGMPEPDVFAHMERPGARPTAPLGATSCASPAAAPTTTRSPPSPGRSRRVRSS